MTTAAHRRAQAAAAAAIARAQAHIRAKPPEPEPEDNPDDVPITPDVARQIRLRAEENHRHG